MSIVKGVLYVVATPIGNREDITLRALNVLRSVHQIAAEDTRHSKNLLSFFDIRAPLVSLHEHNERQNVPRLLAALAEGGSIALISDAGTPLISDPGFHLVRSARDAGIPVVPIPGPSALICALSAAGLPTDRFVFEGFLPSRRAARKARLAWLKDERRTLVFYESCHRVIATLQDMADCFGGSQTAVIARELTKVFETIRKGTLDELLAYLKADANHRKGEFVVLVEGAADVDPKPGSDDAQGILEALLTELSLKQAASLTAKITGRKRNSLYEMGLALAASSADKPDSD